MPSKTFTFTGEWERWKVPNGVEMVSVDVKGGGSGSRPAGHVTGNLRVKDVEALYIMVGHKGFAAEGKNGGAGCFGGGGPGGNGGTGHDGGDGGGGASAIRLNSSTGTLRAVAGGAGGKSGDGGTGGRGGSDIGEQGQSASSSPKVASATGGTQNQGGKGGTSTDYPGLYGDDAKNGKLGRGGRGGQSGLDKSDGGGGGGGGYYAGGGGQGCAIGIAPGGGGAGGSNYIGGLVSAQTYRGGGGTGHGEVTITWDTTTPPTPPSDIKISTTSSCSDGHPIADGLATKATNSVLLCGTPKDTDADDGVRMLVWMSTSSDFVNHQTFRGTWDASGKRDKVTLQPLDQDNRYYLRIYTQDRNGTVSLNYVSTNFWTNRKPEMPTLVTPAENQQVTSDLNITFDWTHNDPDDDDPQKAWKLRYRKMSTPLQDAGEWVTIEHSGSASSWVIDAGTFKSNTFYEWGVRTQDQQDRWGEWSFSRSFFVTGATTPPELLSPVNDEAVVAGAEAVFRWKFKSPQKAAMQSRADLRYRVVGSTDSDWVTLFGTESEPGTDRFWVIPAETFSPAIHYEWQMRTYDDSDLESEWCEAARFWGADTPGTGAGLDPILSGAPAEPLGQGINRAYLAMRGGEIILGELTPLADITWTRRRDDIATNTLHMTQWDDDTKQLLRSMRSWIHEIVVFRETQGEMRRVAEGPVVRRTSRKGYLEIEFRDVMAYAYRRIMRQGYNDSYRIIDGRQVGLTPVTKRAKQILLNALAYDDPNVLPYLTTFEFADDAQCSRVRKDYSATAWEEIDDLAAKGGLDYTASGRRIILWDTHRPIGRLPMLQAGDFSEDPLITEYGASLANVFAVTNNNGLYGVATKGLTDGKPGPEGFIEQLASSYSESEGAGTERTLTREARKRLVASLKAQAQRNIAGRWTTYGPSPQVVRVPDNATLNPTVNIGINQLIPGVWLPLRVDDGIVDVAQWQKLDSVTVTQDDKGEKISVVLSAAPNNGQDPDADEAEEEA